MEFLHYSYCRKLTGQEFLIYERCWGQSPYAVDGHLGPSSSVITAHCNLYQGSPPENVGQRWLQLIT